MFCFASLRFAAALLPPLRAQVQEAISCRQRSRPCLIGMTRTTAGDGARQTPVQQRIGAKRMGSGPASLASPLSCAGVRWLQRAVRPSGLRSGPPSLCPTIRKSSHRPFGSLFWVRHKMPYFWPAPASLLSLFPSPPILHFAPIHIRTSFSACLFSCATSTNCIYRAIFLFLVFAVCTSSNLHYRIEPTSSSPAALSLWPCPCQSPPLSSSSQ